MPFLLFCISFVFQFAEIRRDQNQKLKFDNSQTLFFIKFFKILVGRGRGEWKNRELIILDPKLEIPSVLSFSHPLTWLDVEAAEKMVWRRKLPYQSLFSLSLSTVLIDSNWNISGLLEENGFVWNRSKIMFAKNCQVILFEDSCEESNLWESPEFTMNFVPKVLLN